MFFCRLYDKIVLVSFAGCGRFTGGMVFTEQLWNGGIDMSINIQAKRDVSFLFSSLGSGAAGVAGSNFLADYASIKNGSYAKLMKAYYSGSASESVKSAVRDNSSTKKAGEVSKSSEESKAYAKVQSSADALKNSADALLANGTKSVFAQKDITTKDENGVETTEKGYDTEAIYKAVNSFVSNYNAVINAADKVDSDAVARRTGNMMNATAGNLKSLLAVGISVNNDGTLDLDKDTFMKSDMSTAKALFNGNGSYGYRVSSQASMIDYAAGREVNNGNLYTAKGYYSTNFSSGNLFNSGL